MNPQQQLETKRIRSNNYIVQVIGRYVCIVLFGVLYFLFLPNKYTGPYLEKFNLPRSIFIIGYLFIVVDLFIALYFAVGKMYMRGMVRFDPSSIFFKNKEFEVNQMKDLQVLFNPLKYKPKTKRTIFNGGGNNRIKFRYDRKKYSFEFLLENKEDEELFRDIMSLWGEKVKLTTGISSELVLLDLFDR